jgi:hypothetical protein
LQSNTFATFKKWWTRDENSHHALFPIIVCHVKIDIVAHESDRKRYQLLAQYIPEHLLFPLRQTSTSLVTLAATIALAADSDMVILEEKIWYRLEYYSKELRIHAPDFVSPLVCNVFASTNPRVARIFQTIINDALHIITVSGTLYDVCSAFRELTHFDQYLLMTNENHTDCICMFLDDEEIDEFFRRARAWINKTVD